MDKLPTTFQLVIKYQKGKANSNVNCLSRPPITLLSKVMSMQGYNTTTWSQLYLVYYDFFVIYRQLYNEMLSTADYYLKDTLLYKLGHLCVPTDENR